MVELHYRDANTGDIYRAIYENADAAQEQASHDVEMGTSSKVPIAIVEHDPATVFDGVNYDASLFTVVKVLDQSAYDQA